MKKLHANNVNMSYTGGYKKYWLPNVVMYIERLEAIGIFQFFQFQTF